MERYLKIDKLGEGTYGIVYKVRQSTIPRMSTYPRRQAQDRTTGEIVALKRIRLDNEDEVY